MGGSAGDPITRRARRSARIVRAAVVCTTLIALVASFVSPEPALASRTRSRQVAPGVVHRVIRSNHPRRVVHVVVADMSGPLSLKVGLATGTLPGVEPVASMARRHRAVAAINGDYFRPSGRPVAAFATGGRLIQTPLAWGANIAFGRGGMSAFIGHQDVKVRLLAVGAEISRRVARVNLGRPHKKQVRMYTRQGGRLARPPRNACSARLVRRSAFTVHPDSSEVSATYRVAKVACRRSRMALKRGTVVAARRWGPGADYVRDLRSQGRQQLRWSLGWPRVAETLGGNPVLVKDGAVAWNNLKGVHSPLFKPNPRTGVGLRKDGKIMFVTVDGRRPRYSRGISMIGFAKLMRSLGAEWALNLDGGGSTTMVVRGKVTNRPSDGRPRAVGSSLMIVRKGAGIRTVHRAPSDPPDDEPLVDLDEALEGRVSIAVAEQDPASIGGLTSWLESRDKELPPSLRGVASRFDAARTSGRVDR